MANIRKCVDCGEKFIVSIKDTRENYYCPDCDKKWKNFKAVIKYEKKRVNKSRRQAQ